MATKLPTRVCYTELRRRCPKNQEEFLKRMMQRRRDYQQRLAEYPERPPPINWDYYKRNVRSEAVSMVETFEKKYTNMTIPRPQDKYSEDIEKLKVEIQKDVEEFKKKSNERIAGYQKQIDKIRSLMPFNEMTMEDFFITHPERSLDFINKPTFWPHNPEEQIGYIPPKLGARRRDEKRRRRRRKLDPVTGLPIGEKQEEKKG